MPLRRIVSLVPSLTEFVVWLERGDLLVGRTKFCTEPAGRIESIPTVGGTKNPNIARITELHPDIVLANKEENRKEDVEGLRARGVEVLLTDPNTVGEAIAMIRGLGARLGASAKAESLAGEVAAALAEVGEGSARSVYAAVWHSPMMGLGSATYGHSLLEACGARNALRDRERYPELTMDELRQLHPSLILLPDEPFPFDASHAAVYSKIAPARVIDGKLLWWYGPRMPAAIRALSRLFGEVASE